MAKHSKSVQKDKFCALRTGSDQKCPKDGNNYRDNCKPKWVDFTFYQGSKKAVEKEYEAHHLLCVASITGFLAKKRKLGSVIKQTDWCINAKKNMIAMPLWGHTIKYYCDIETQRLKLQDRFKEQGEQEQKKGPSFRNIPQHDYDHNSKKGYKQEVDKEIKNIALQVEDEKDKHNEAVANLQQRLNELSDKCRELLKQRGRRCKGTHMAWEDARTKGLKNWYEPFSMADDGNVDPKAFPLAGYSKSELANKIKSLVKAFGTWGR